MSTKKHRENKPESKKDMWRIGIQGGKGSFNEEAIHLYLHEHKIRNYKIKYLYTTKNVLKALGEGKIDRGMFAIQNSLSGMVFETINALSEYNCKILESYELNISHTLFVHPESDGASIERIISHPVAHGQCKKTLSKLYPNAERENGKGRMIDQAVAAKALAQGKLAGNTAVLAAPYCEKLYDLKVLERNLRDSEDNFTTFLFVSRFER